MTPLSPDNQQPALRGLFYWRVVAWWLLAVVVTLTLIPNPDGSAIGFELNDKVAHFSCYAALAVAFGCLRQGQRLLLPMTLLMLLGALLEVAQLLSMYGRMFEFWDMLANCSGVVLGSLLMLTPLRKTFYWLERLAGRHAE